MTSRNRALAFIYTFLLVAQTGIVVTGGAVRLTGSGLGCPTWPQCTGTSYKPVAHQAQGQLHSWIEFGNRLLTAIIILAILIAAIGYFKWGRHRSDAKRLRTLILLQFLGIVAQIVVGGISVLTHLNPFAVGTHFIISILIIAATVSLRNRMLNVQLSHISDTSRQLSRLVLLLAFIVINLGILVTGSGPHAGDEAAGRFGLDPRTISWIHADSVIAMLGLSVGLWFLLKSSADSNAQNAFSFFVIASLAQGFIGYTQYFTKLPEILVGAHMLGACLVWISIWNYGFKTSLLKRENTK